MSTRADVTFLATGHLRLRFGHREVTVFVGQGTRDRFVEAAGTGVLDAGATQAEPTSDELDDLLAVPRKPVEPESMWARILDPTKGGID